MAFMPATAVRLRATSELLFIETVDEDAAVAYCQSYGSGGPEGDAKPYPLDSLRENVQRNRTTELVEEASTVRRLCCRLGIHVWKARTFRNRPILGDIDIEMCRYCGNIRQQP